MHYLSTRGGDHNRRFSDILLTGLAPDGGLYVPEPDQLPKVSHRQLQQWVNLDYAELALHVILPFVDDLPADVLRNLLAQTYNTQQFAHSEITPVSPLFGSLSLLELSHGPSLAFKDMALQLLGGLFEQVLSQRQQRLTIVGATSGDTGSSAEYAMKGRKRVHVFMLSPYQRMSPFQTAQMFSLNEPNIHNIAVDGVFDDCQDLVKQVNQDTDFKQRFHVGAVNSINWARILAQVVYYFKGYLATVKRIGDPVSFAVPSGNFGNIYAGTIARRMGLPIHQLILATNENNVLAECVQTGHYRIRNAKEVHATSSPSMDIAKASNFERFMFDLLEGNSHQLNRLWQQLQQQGEIQLSADQLNKIDQAGLVAGSSSHQNRLDTIAEVYERCGRIIDPHTADGVFVAQQYADQCPVICLETALPIKFADTIRQALGKTPPLPEAYRDLESKPQHFTHMVADVERLKAFISQRISY